MIQVKTVLSQIIGDLSLNLDIDSVTDNGDGTYTLSVDNTQYLNVGASVTLDSVDYTVTSFILNDSVTISGDSAPTTGIKTLPNPTFAHGKYKAVNSQLSMRQPIDYMPLVWMYELLPRTQPDDPLSLIDSEGQVRMFFCMSAKWDDWETADHYTEVFDPLNNVIDALIQKMRVSPMIGELGAIERTNHPKFATGGNTIDGGQESAILPGYVSAVEVIIDLPILQSTSSCNGLKDTSCAPGLVKDQEGNELGLVPSGGFLQVNTSGIDATVENSDNSYNDTVASGGTLVLPDIQVTDSDGSTSSFPSVKDVVCTPVSDASVENSDGTYTDTVASGGTLILPDITVTDSDGSTSSVPSVQNVLCTPSADATVENSDSSYTNTVASGGTLTLPDITVTDSDGSTFTQPSVVNVVCSLAADGTVNVNSVFFDNVASGGTLNIEVRQSNGITLIGSKQGQYFIIPDSVITLDNTDGTTLSTTNVLATDPLTLTAPDATAVIKNTLNAVLRSELIPSNVSEDIIIGDATININQSDGTLISSVTVTAEGSGVYNVADSTVNVLNSLGTVLSSSSVKATDTTNVSAPDANVENSDASYVNTIPSNGTLVLPDIQVTDSDGTTSSFPSVKNVSCTPAADANVENSDGSYLNTVASGGTLVLPDITVTDSDGSTFTQPSVVNVVCTPGTPTPSLITIYNRPIITFSSTSFLIGDTAWQVSQGLFDGWQDSASTSKFWRLQQLDSSAANPSKTLLYNNPFGNTDRYTDHLGTQVYASGVWIDNLTGIMYPTNVGQFNSANWANTLVAVEAYTDALGNADYHVPPSQLIISLFVYSNTGNPYDDWNGIITGESSARRYWCADTRNASTTNKFYTQLASTGQILTVSETNTTTSCLPYRILTQPT